MAGTPSAARGGSVYISTNLQNRKRKVARLGHKMSDFAICKLVDRWRQKKRMENSQMRNSQIAIAEIWDTLVGSYVLQLLRVSRIHHLPAGIYGFLAEKKNACDFSDETSHA